MVKIKYSGISLYKATCSFWMEGSLSDAQILQVQKRLSDGFNPKDYGLPLWNPSVNTYHLELLVDLPIDFPDDGESVPLYIDARLFYNFVMGLVPNYRSLRLV